MKTITIFFSVFFVVFSAFSQENPITNPNTIVKLNDVTLQKDIQVKMNKVTLEAKNIIKKSELEKKKNNENENAKITSDLNKKLNVRTIDNKRIINPNKPVIAEVYFPDSKGVKPNGEFVLLGNNFFAKNGVAEVTVEIGHQTLICRPLVSNCSPERLHLVMPDFSGIFEPINVLLTVNSDGLKSNPANITIAPEIVTTQLDLSKFDNQLQSDSQHSIPTVKANNTNDGKHIYIIDGNTILWVNHSCRLNNENSSTEYRGIDKFFVTTQLKNNWVIKDVIFYDNLSKCGSVNAGQTSANLSSIQRNSPSLKTQIGWYNNQNMCFQSSYLITYIIEGPKGTNYW